MAKSKKKSKIVKPQAAKADPIDESIKSSVIAAALTVAKQPVLMKVCRLCGTEEGPFLNIFDPEQVTAIKIDQIMPFKVAENDDLPHKICFRCSVKVEELHQFIQKSVETQKKFHSTLGKKAPVISKYKTRSIWEEKLNKSNMSNDDICNALIKRAMEGIKDIPLRPLPTEEEKVVPKKEPTKSQLVKSPLLAINSFGAGSAPAQKEDTDSDSDDKNDMSLKQIKLNIDKCDQKVSRKSRSGLAEKNKKPESKNDNVEDKQEVSKVVQKQTETSDSVKNMPANSSPAIEAKDSKEFNIMDHVTMIKVNGVGVLYQCKLCNRNFLKKDVILSHGCAKNGVPKVDFSVNLPPPEPPKVTTVKYINTKVNNDLKKSEDIEISKPAVKESKPPVKEKPRIGPASKTGRNRNDCSSGAVVENKNDTMKVNQSETPAETTPPVPNHIVPTVRFPTLPNLERRYKLLPGPNNTFTLVENPPHLKKRKSDEETITVPQNDDEPYNSSTSIESDSQSASKPATVEQPYPVGLFQTVSHPTFNPTFSEPPPLSLIRTPAMKKQSYTVVQTGNPSKLLISTIPQTPVEEVPKKRSKKVKVNRNEESKEPFSVTLEDANHPKDTGFFTFINVDPLLQPSYVLPTDNIIQESQISTSTSVAPETADSKEKEKYSCNMCNETFSREKKLLAHIHSHYNKMDEEDLSRREKSNSRKRSKRH